MYVCIFIDCTVVQNHTLYKIYERKNIENDTKLTELIVIEIHITDMLNISCHKQNMLWFFRYGIPVTKRGCLAIC